MAARSKTPSVKQPAILDAAQMRKGIKLIERRIADLEELDPATVSGDGDPQILQLSKSIDTTLIDVFGPDSLEYERYLGATKFSIGPFVIRVRGEAPSIHEVRSRVEACRAKNLAILQGVVKTLKEKLEDYEDDQPEGLDTPKTSRTYARKAFIVHGHDISCRDAVELFLKKLDFDYVILNQQANEGRTIIEKIEAHSDVGFAIVLLTPDDQCDIAGQLEKRARQNVMWEYGYFVGRLGRKRVCVLKRENVKIPSDLEGIGWIRFDSTDQWQIGLAKELKSAGYDIDMNKVIS